jgi:S1-C subfamily serine protease
VDASGKVTGICTSGLARGAAVAVPAATVERVVDALLAGGGATRSGYLGIGTQLVPLPDAVRAILPPIGDHVPRAGLMVVAVQPGTSAERAGILLGDLLVGLGDEAIEDPRDVMAALGPDSVGTTLRATIVRAGAPISVDVTIDPHPARN